MLDKDGTSVFQKSKSALSQFDASPAEIEAAKKNFVFMPEGSSRATVRLAFISTMLLYLLKVHNQAEPAKMYL